MDHMQLKLYQGFVMGVSSLGLGIALGATIFGRPDVFWVAAIPSLAGSAACIIISGYLAGRSLSPPVE
jgi:ABC-type antimicrobial peptide transport system permease subunit